MHTFVVDTLLNLPMPFDIILTYPNTFRVNALRRLLVLFFWEGGDLRQKRVFFKNFIIVLEKKLFFTFFDRQRSIYERR